MRSLSKDGTAYNLPAKETLVVTSLCQLATSLRGFARSEHIETLLDAAHELAQKTLELQTLKEPKA